jgi:N-acetyl-anhydromuramyl-L-alanine amidase AmpD
MCVTERPSGRARGAVLVLAACAACGKPPTEPPCPVPARRAGAVAVDSQPSPFDAAFASAGAEFSVPPSLLKAIGWVETRWHMVQGTEEFPGVPSASGVMALRGEQLGRGAALAHVTIEDARRDSLANIRAAAALLNAYAVVAGIDRSRPEAWASVVVRFSGIAVPEGRAAYTRDVDRALPPGQRLAAPAVPAAPLAGPCPPPPPPGPDYAPAVWRPSPNFNDRPVDSTGLAHVVIIHTCEGGYTGCWSWLVNPVSQVSAHYVVDEEGTEISQLVREPQRAWHIAALYDCALNRGHACALNGVQGNHFTVGIEHAGFASQDSFPVSQLAASAALVCDATRRLDIPRDWQHIVGHGQLQPQNRTDPGPHWPWIPYLHRIQADCDELVVDDSAAFNAPGAATAAMPAAWGVSVATPDYYGGGYHWATTAPDAVDSAVFSFHLDSPGRRAVDARWTSGTNRSPRAEYVVIDAAGAALATVRMDQRTDGGRWQQLGSWTFPAGWNRVALLRRDSSGAVVVADAVRIRRQPVVP